jgi:outer membrane protein TolC
MKSLRLKTFEVHATRLLVGIVLASSAVLAQTLITRSQALEAARNSASVLAAQARVAASEAQASAAGLPISGSANAGYAWNGVDPKPPGRDAVKGDWTYGVQVSYAGLFGEAGANRVTTGLNVERARRAALTARGRAGKNAVALWHGLRRAEAGVSSAIAARELAELQDKASEARLNAGAINAGDRETARVSLETAKLDEARANARLDGVRLQLEAVLGLRGSSAPEWSPLPLPPEAVNIEAREDLFEARAALVQADLDLNRGRQALFPKLNLDGGITGSSGSLNGQVNSDLAASASFSSPTPGLNLDSTSWKFGVSVVIPIEPGKISALGALEVSVNAARSSLEAAILAAKADVAAKRSALVLARSGLTLSQRNLDLSTQNLERAKQRLAAGVLSSLDVKRAESELGKAREGLYTAQAELDNATLEVFEAINQPLEAQ